MEVDNKTANAVAQMNENLERLIEKYDNSFTRLASAGEDIKQDLQSMIDGGKIAEAQNALKLGGTDASLYQKKEYVQYYLANNGAPIYVHELASRAYETASGIEDGTKWYDGFWSDELAGGGLIHSALNVPRSFGDNYFVWELLEPMVFTTFQYKGRNHPHSSYLGTGRLSASNNPNGDWTVLVTQNEVGQGVLTGITQINNKTKYKYFRWDMWGSSSGYQVVNQLKIGVRV